MSKPKVYLAGPGVFRPDASAIAEQLRALCDHYDLEGLWPADGDPSPVLRATPFSKANHIYRRNLLMIAECQAVVADISPFRGPHMDVGVAFEIGLAVATRRPVFAYTDEPTILIGRMRHFKTGDIYVDAQGNVIEDFDLVENLMIACSVPAVFKTPAEAIAECARYLMDAAA